MDGVRLAYKLLHDVNELAGRLNDALAAALDGAEATRRLGSPRFSTGFQGMAANFAFRLGRWEEADRLFRAVLEQRPLLPSMEAYARLERARLDIARGDIIDMRRWLQDAEELARKAGRAWFDEMWGPMLVQCRAEQTRLHGQADPALWAAAAARWEMLSQPYAATYARFREAEALLASKAPHAQVAARLRAAHAVAARLGAAPLRRDLERLAQRGRIRLQAPGQAQ